MSRENRPRRKRNMVLLALLALLCVGAAELTACRIFAPELFQQITAPVVSWVSRAASAGEALADRVFSSRTSDEESPPVSQLAGAPAIQEPPTLEDPAITEFVQRNGREVLTGGVVEVVYYNQGEEPWAEQPYGPDHIGGYGCGPTAMAMLVSSLSDQAADPAQMAAWAYEQGYCAPGSGSYYGLVPGAAEAYGLTAETWTDFSPDSLKQELASGHLFVALMGPGHFTNSGHFILLRGVTLEGKVLVADPNSRERSLTAWDPEVILDELSGSRGSGAPLWRFFR